MKTKTRRIKRRFRPIETQIVESADLLSTYPYCALPTHFFDRVKADALGEPGRELLTVDRWDGRKVISVKNS